MEMVGIFERVTTMAEQKFDFKKVMNRKVNTNIIVKEKNKPNIEKMANAFFQLIRK